MSNLLYCKLADELWMLAVSFLPIEAVLPSLPLAGKYFNDVVWGPNSGSLMWREVGLDARVFKAWLGENPPSQTALMRACARGAPLAHVLTLVNGGATRCVNAVDSRGWTALLLASMHGRVDAVRKLLEANADPNIADNRGWTPLMLASARGHSAVVATLVADRRCDVNHADNEGWTALMWASSNNHVNVTRLLVENGVDITIRRSDGRTALDIARDLGNDDIIHILETEMFV